MNFSVLLITSSKDDAEKALKSFSNRGVKYQGIYDRVIWGSSDTNTTHIVGVKIDIATVNSDQKSDVDQARDYINSLMVADGIFHEALMVVYGAPRCTWITAREKKVRPKVNVPYLKLVRNSN